MKKLIVLAAILLVSCELTPAENGVVAPDSSAVAGTATGATGAAAGVEYNAIGLDGGTLSFDAFQRAFEGYVATPERRRDVLTIIDFTLPSTAKRLWVIDMAAHRVLFNTLVAHGQGSGENYATRFSNRSGSHQSSLGRYLTGGTYMGGNGYSMFLDGLEPGVNDNARSRSVVVHGAAYANPSVIAHGGRLGRSWGCPALPLDEVRPVIDAIKDGSVLFIYGG
jgi:hypothetical protein